MNRRPIVFAALLLIAILLAVYLRSRPTPETQPGHAPGAGAAKAAPGGASSSENGGSGSQESPPAENTVAAKLPSSPDAGVKTGSGVVHTPQGKHIHAEAVEVATRLSSPDTSPEDDIESVNTLLAFYRLFFKENPVAEDNEAVTRALTGSNPKGMVLIPPDHPSIDSQGRLVDRWQTPYFFHALSEKKMEIFSAGPDKVFDTGDDLHEVNRGDRPLTGAVWTEPDEEEE